jgi:hypothetical protein
MKLNICIVRHGNDKNIPLQFNIVCQKCNTLFSGMEFHFSDLLRNASTHKCPNIITQFDIEFSTPPFPTD